MMNINNVGKNDLRMVVDRLYRVGVSYIDILSLLQVELSPTMVEIRQEIRKQYPRQPKEGFAYQDQMAYLAELISMPVRHINEDLLADFLRGCLKINTLKDYIDGLLSAHYYCMHIEVPEKDMVYAHLLENIFECVFIQNDANYKKFFEGPTLVTEYLLCSHRRSRANGTVKKFVFPRSIGELRSQLAIFAAKSKGSKHIGVGLAWDDTWTVAALYNVLNDLTKQEQEVLMLRFGIENGVCMSYEQMAQLCSIDSEHIQRLECKALEKLRQPRQIERLKHILCSCHSTVFSRCEDHSRKCSKA